MKKYGSFLFIFLLVFLAFSGSFSYGKPGWQRYDETEEFHKSLKLGADGVFSLVNINGSVSIETWNRDEVDIQAEKAVRGRRSNLDRIEIVIEARANHVTVDTIFPKIRNFRGKVTYAIKVPEGLVLDKISTTNGDIEISGPVKDVRISSTNGNLKVSRIEGLLVGGTTNGDIRAEDLNGEVDVHSTNGNIVLNVRSVSDEIGARTTNGSISLTIRANDIDADVEARTTNGRITVDFPVTLSSGQISKRRLNGRIGSGGPLISLKTTNGAVKILQ